MEELQLAAATLLELLRFRAQREPQATAYRFLADSGEEELLTYGELDRKARALAALLQSRNAQGERALLLFQPGMEYLIAFFGCLYAGVFAVPAYPPRQNGNLSRLQAVVADSRAAFALATGTIAASVARRAAAEPELARLDWIVTDELSDAGADAWREPQVTADTLAFLQYTSGSTALPKGVMLTHGNLLHNLALIERSFGTTRQSSGVVWLPPYHDMGLIGGILQPLFTGYPMTLMAPVSFITKPLRWLEAISRTGATVSGGPNFAYELCVQKITPEQRDTLDLSSWENAFTGAEPIRKETLDRFAAFFAPCGFRKEAFYPCYGLAEGTLFVTGGRKQEAPIAHAFSASALKDNFAETASDEADAQLLVSSGRPALGDQEVLVVDPERLTPCAYGQVGEIWVNGPSVAKGYWERAEQTRETFGAELAAAGKGPYLRTGDLGFLQEGELYITGRRKDLIIIRGRNYYPQDIEFTVQESHPAVHNSNGAAFAVEADGEERLVIVQEIERSHRKADLNAVIASIRERVSSQHELQVYAVVLLKPASIPKTSSGKIQRHKCKERFLDGTLDAVADARADRVQAAQDLTSEAPADVTRELLLKLDLADRRASLEQELLQKLAQVLQLDPSRLTAGQPLTQWGLDSLMAVEVKNAVEEQFGLDVPFALLLEGVTVNELAAELSGQLEGLLAQEAKAEGLLEGQSEGQSSDLTHGLPKESATGHATGLSAMRSDELSYGQRSLWFLQKLAPESTAYHVARAVQLPADLEVPRLQRAFEQLTHRHDALRSVFVDVDGEPKLNVKETAGEFWAVEDACGWTEEQLQARLAAAARTPIDLEKGPLLRVHLFLREAGPVLLFHVHHIAVDFWTFGVFLQELGQLYAGLKLPPVKAGYAEYVQWQQALLQSPKGEALQAYWEQTCADVPLLQLPADRPRPAVLTDRGASVRFALPAELSAGLKRLAQEQGVTLYAALLAAYQVLLHRVTGQDDIVVGTPTVGRSSAKFSETAGYFVNPVPLRARLGGETSFAAFLQEVKATVVAALLHQDYPFALLAERLQPDRDPSFPPLFQTMFTLQKSHLAGGGGLGAFALGEAGAVYETHGLRVQSLPFTQSGVQLDVALTMAERDGELAGVFEYNADLFDTVRIERLCEHFVTVLGGIVQDAQAKIAALPLLTLEQREAVLAWRGQPAPFERGGCLHQLFEHQAERTPERIAVVSEAGHVTYAELNARANALANALVTRGVGPGVLVALCAERSVEMVVGLLGVMKAGGAYVPVDPGYPAERIAYMLADADAKLLLTQEHLLDKLPVEKGATICLDKFVEACEEPCSIPNATEDDPAYVIYTSGSTGQPKGVVIPHRAIVNHMRWMQQQFPLTADDVVLQKTAFSFDASVWEFYAPLFAGAQLVLARPGGQADPAYLVQAVQTHGVTTLQVVPSMLKLMLEEPNVEACVSLRRLFCGGETLTAEHVQTFHARLRGQLVNLYGPTEAAIDTTFHICAPEDAQSTVPIGKPIAGAEVYVLDAAQQLVPVGVPGELYIGGAGLALGYLKKPEQTEQKFILHPYGAGRLYRTGDSVRWREDGSLEFLGRLDDQVKLRGFRIELAEIEAMLRGHEEVQEAAVVLRDQRLAAYVVGAGEADLRTFLKARLPEYMVPSAFVALDRLPLTANGKVDRNALPAPVWTGAGEGAYVAPRTETEAGIALVWQEVLGVEQVGLSDNFFALGGHSLLAAQAVSRLNRRFAIDLPLRTLFASPTVAELAAEVQHLAGSGATPLVPVSRDAALPLSFAQERLWFIDRLEGASALYNIPGAVRLSGELDVSALERSLQEIVTRHEALRTIFTVTEGSAVQQITDGTGFTLTVTDSMEEEVPHIALAEAQLPFDLEKGPLLRAKLLRLAADDHVLMLTMHHIAADGWSMGVLLRELSALYAAFMKQEASPLQPLAVQYADYAVWQQADMREEVLEQQLSYWKQKLSGELPVLQLPTDRPRPAVQSSQGAVLSFALPASLSEQVRELAVEGTTLFTLLLTAYKTLLYRYTGLEDLLVGTPVAGRRHVEIEPLIGFFVNTLVLRDAVDGSMTFRQLLESVKTTALEALSAQDVPFEKLVGELQPERSRSHSPLFQAMFTWQPSPLAELKLPGVSHAQVEMHSGTAKFDLTLMMEEQDGQLAGAIEYRTDLFDRATIGRLAGHFQTLLQAAVQHPDCPIAELPMLSAAEQAQMALWNDTARPEVLQLGVHEWFEVQADATPDAVALVFGKDSLTYSELNERANRLARRLQQHGVLQGQMVGFCIERSLELVVGMLAILKAGAAYVPFDADYPAERLRYQLGDANVSLLLTQERLLAKLPEHGAQILCVDGTYAEESGDNLGLTTDLDSLAYVMYTSGSTGQPKGVMVPHRGVVRLVKDTDYVEFSARDVFLQFAPVAFDAATFEIWGALLNGAQLVIFPPGQASLQELGRVIQRHGVSTLWLTAGLFHQMAEHHLEGLRGVRQLLAGGDVLSVPHVQKVVEQLDCRLINGYGPTECTTFAVCHEVQREDLLLPSLPIGRAIANTTVVILSGAGQPVPVGVPGELHLGGAGVALGYWNQPELTAERFINTEHGRLYKTGDMVRRLADGTIEFLGRTDNQVKVRGFRIELGEIEAAAAKHPNVREAVVLVREDVPGDKRIVAYVTLHEAAEGTDALRRHLQASLPSYMVPQQLIAMDAFALTANGKVDRKSLPAPEWTASDREFTAPRTAVEAQLCALFETVLQAQPVGIHDDFFALGGHSLLATQAVTRIEAAFGIELPLRQLFEAPTVAELAAFVDGARGAHAAPIRRTARGGDLPMSYAQERMWLLHQFHSDSSAYHIAGAVRMRGPLDRAALERSMAAIVQRHEALRTTFDVVNDQAVQRIRSAQAVTIPLSDLTELPTVEREETALRLAREDAREPFDLTKDELVRLSLLRLGAEDHLLVMTLHHIISDGWSLGVLLQELSVLYGGGELPELTVQYADYAQWHRSWLEADALASQLDYWKHKLGGSLPVLQLPTDRPRPAVQTTHGAHLPFALSKELTEALKGLGQAGGETLYMILLTAFNVLLHRYTGQDDILVGSPIAGRNRVEIENLIGFFVNTIVLRSELPGETSFRSLLKQVKQTALEAYAHQDVPFEKLVSVLQPERSTSHPPLFQVMFALQNAPLALELPGLRLERLTLDNQTAKFDLSLLLEETEQGLTGFLEYNTDLFEQATIARLAQHFQTLLQAAVLHPDRPIAELPMLTAAERGQLAQWNDTERPEALKFGVHQWFERQTAATPDAAALIFGEDSLTYRELNEQANRLARRLQKRGVAPGQLVGLSLERSFELVIGMLAILKAGAAYVPFDADYPAERLRYQLEDANVAVLVTSERMLDRLPEQHAQILCIEEPFAEESAENLGIAGDGDSLAYMMYTSGSTGQPKGVMVPHRGVVRLVKDTDYVEFSARDVFLQFAPVAFDAATFEIWGALLNGAQMVIYPPGQASLQELGRVIQRYGVSTLWLTAGLFHQMAEHHLEGLRGVRQLLAGGDVLSVPHVQKVVEQLDCRLINGYGPTECTTFAVCHEVRQEDLLLPSLPIGRAIANTTAYVLDEAGQEVPIGVRGELHLSGAGVALGYWQRPELTAERFLNTEHGRLYKTGDMVRRLADGTIEFLGRTDNQVKVRGFRIELGEIEAAVAKHPTVSESAVLVREDQPGDKRIVAYVILKQPEDRTGELRRDLKAVLPSYMMPQHIVAVEAMALTANGKIDRTSLPAPAAAEEQREYAPPRTAAEAMLCALFEEVLHTQPVGIHDDFFAAGGHSLLATQAVTRIQAAFGIEMPLRKLFELPTVAELAAFVTGTEAGAADAAPIVRVARDGHLPLSFAQERMWLLHQLLRETTAYHIPGAVRMHGTLDREALERSFATIVNRHESLRTSFATVNGQAVQQVRAEQATEIQLTDLTALPANEREATALRLAREAAQRPFDLTSDALVRLALFRLGEGDHLLVMVMHHIISDGWSLGVLLEELSMLYGGGELPELEVQYADYAAWQRDWLQGENLDRQLNYWKRKLSGSLPVLQLPSDRPRPVLQTTKGAHLPFALSKELTEELRALGQADGATLYMVLLTAFNVLMYRYTGQDDLLVGSPIAGRHRAEIEPLIGFFVNTLVLRSDLSEEPAFSDLLAQVKQTALEAYAHQDVPFEQLVGELQPERNLSHTPLFQVMFALQNAPLALELPGLTLERVSLDIQTAKFDLSLLLEETEGGVSGIFEYNTDLFDEATIERMAGHFHTLLQSVIQDREQKISHLPLLTEAEAAHLYHNEAQAHEFAPSCLHQLFEAQAARTPDAVAIQSETGALSYAELNERANRLAQYLQEQGAGPDGLIAICMARSPELVIAILAVLKSGAAYVPIDPAYPADRIAFLLADGGAPLLLTESQLLPELPPHDAKAICLDRDGALFAAKDTANPKAAVGPQHLAYIIYTSGSTGQPKGVAIEHRQASSLIQWAHEVFPPEELQGVLFSTSVCFDLSIFELFAPLCCGGRVILAQNALQLPAMAAKDQVTLINTVPSAIAELLRLEAIPPSVKVVNLAGEPLKLGLVSALYEVATLEKVYNLYGPSEDTTYSTYERMERGLQTKPLIGVPITGTQAYVLDAAQQPVPFGVPGELFLGGAGVARGYLGRPDLTAEKFVEDPFSKQPHARMYRTGDLVRALPDGRLDYLGRLDHQVKVRGFRIELGEIEAALLQHPAVRETVVMVREDAAEEKRIVAYLVTKAGELTTAELRDWTGRTLPGYMIPSAFVRLEAMPLTANGKVDRKALPAPDGARHDGTPYLAPQTDTEQKLSAIWSDVLGAERVGLLDNFFEIGGHSLKATQIASRIAQELCVEIPLRDLFEHPTVSQLAVRVEQAQHAGHEAEAMTILPYARQELPDRSGTQAPMSTAQRRMWLLDQLLPGSPLYNVPGVVRLTGTLNAGAVEQSLLEIARRHDVLRAAFREAAGELVQVAQHSVDLALQHLDLTHEPQADREKLALAAAAEEVRRPFDLASGPPMRAMLIKLEAEEHLFLFLFHHIVADGWSLGLFVREWSALYEAFSRGLPSPLTELRIQYADYAQWQQQRFAGDVLTRQLSYWKEQLGGELPVLQLPTDRPRPAVQTYAGRVHRFALGADLTQRLHDLSRREGATLFMTLLSAFKTLLYRYSGQTDLLIGTPIAGRSTADVEALFGLFMNTLVIRSDLSGNPSFRDVLQRVKEATFGAFAHQEVPFELLVDELQPVRDMSYSPLFQVMFILQNAPMPAPQLQDLAVKVLEVDSDTAKFDLTLALEEQGDELQASLEYNTDLFDDSTVERFAGHFIRLLENIAEKPQQAVATLSFLSADELHQELAVWNGNRTTAAWKNLPYTLPELFERQVRHTPDRTAIVDGERRVTFAELNAQANRMAHALRARGVGAETLVGLCMERSVDMLVAILGILKAGGAYVPLDPNYPAERVQYILQHAGAALLITQAALTGLFGTERETLIWETAQAELAAQSEFNLPLLAEPDNLAYVIYTSGSTGLPKGVAIEHKSAVALVNWADETYSPEEYAGVLFSTSVCFDLSVYEMFVPLSLGGTILLADHALHLPLLPAKGEVTLINTVPSAIQELLRIGEVPPGVKVVNLCGEPLKGTIVHELYAIPTVEKVYNLYGPTEDTVYSTVALMSRELAGNPPIGAPLPGTYAYVLSPELQPLPVGAAGELFLGGAGLARGYLHQPELTAERFVADPYAQQKGQRLYRTGDLVRRSPDGTLDYISRIDHQVKVRGFRIELGEIEAVLCADSHVQSAAVTVRTDHGDARIVAYVVATAALTAADCRQIVQQKLPDYMVPSAWVMLDALPLTPNGKIDKKALPAPEQARSAETPYVAPRSELEQVLCDIWAQQLGVEQVGITDNFFDLGGHSLLATQLVSRVRETLQVELALRDLFAARTVEQFAAVVEKARQSAQETVSITKSSNRKTRTRSRS
ncbi:amino acid adenylation domain-containing protein [Tumebacillus sp. BK434]|uniref:non-ribosomal peptide synthetase n=1 Tax=Tumebacillus sp. BK434 TaxID=2512169 RepID=UPI0010539267|nr:non-ribosomal peptide synthase/polyketide synthase [Tumebacillus sp. BK434]TCP59426.1 amino acid adenylation domain-containing protein [Tumebacillus sp. BK434]